MTPPVAGRFLNTGKFLGRHPCANGVYDHQVNSGIGSPSHVSGILFQKAINSPIQMIPYRGAGESTQAIVSAQIDALLNTPAVSMAQLKAGQVKVFAVTAKRRLTIAPDIPTTDEAGLPGFYFTFWHAFWSPKGTPKDVIAKLNAALRATLVDPEIRKKLTRSRKIYSHRMNRARKHWLNSRARKLKSGGRSSRPLASPRTESRSFGGFDNV